MPEVYSDAMARIGKQNAEDAMLARKILRWVAFTKRRLTFDEFQHALAVEPGDTSVDLDAFLDENIMVEICAGLVAVDHSTISDGYDALGLFSRNQALVRLVHYTAQAFFDDIRAGDFPEAHASIATTCLLIYLPSDDLADSHTDFRTLLNTYPLQCHSVV